jgi:selenocysteine-specific elongation factor
LRPLRTYLETHAVLTPGDVRDRFGLSRKYAIPLLEYLDGIKVTIRTPEGRKAFVRKRD